MWSMTWTCFSSTYVACVCARQSAVSQRILYIRVKPWLYYQSWQRKRIFSLTLLFPLCCLKTNIFAEEAAVSGLCWRKRPDWALQEAVLRKPKPSVTSDLCYRCNICTREWKREESKKGQRKRGTDTEVQWGWRGKITKSKSHQTRC